MKQGQRAELVSTIREIQEIEEDRKLSRRKFISGLAKAVAGIVLIGGAAKLIENRFDEYERPEHKTIKYTIQPEDKVSSLAEQYWGGNINSGVFRILFELENSGVDTKQLTRGAVVNIPVPLDYKEPTRQY